MIPLFLFCLYNLSLYLQDSGSKSVVETRSYCRNSYLVKFRQKTRQKIYLFTDTLFKKPGDFYLNRRFLNLEDKKSAIGTYAISVIKSTSDLLTT